MFFKLIHFFFFLRINKLLGCASDCDFSYLLSVPSSFNSQGSYCGDGTYNDTAFAADVMLYLPSDVASTCIFTFCSLASSASAWLEPSASDLLGNLSKYYKLLKKNLALVYNLFNFRLSESR